MKIVAPGNLKWLFVSALGLALSLMGCTAAPEPQPNAVVVPQAAQPGSALIGEPTTARPQVAAATPTQASLAGEPTAASNRVPTQLPASARPQQATSVASQFPTRPRAPTSVPTAVPTQPPTPQLPASLEASEDIGYVPILMYHYVRSVDEASDPLGYRLSVTPERFGEQLAYLHEQGYTSVTMAELAGCLRGETRCPAKIVALTFDDGYEDSYRAALPLLQQYGLRATFYIVPNFVGSPGYMSWEQVRAMHAAGMEIGSHTMNHADLTGLSLEEARVEIGESKRVLEEQLGAPVVSFSYPAGSNTPELAIAVRDAGYSNAVTTAQDIGFAEMFRLARRRVLGGESIAGYPWYLQPLQ